MNKARKLSALVCALAAMSALSVSAGATDITPDTKIPRSQGNYLSGGNFPSNIPSSFSEAVKGLDLSQIIGGTNFGYISPEIFGPGSVGSLPSCDKPPIQRPDCNNPGNPTPEPPKPGNPTPEPPKPDNPTPEPPGPESPKPEPSAPPTLSDYESEVISLVNAEREKVGLSPLIASTGATAAARVRAQEQTVSFSHTRPNGSSCFSALTEAGVKYKGAGENIAMGQKTPAAVMQGWMASEGHRKNILNESFTEIGVGCYKSGNTLYWTQMFTRS